MKYIRAEHLTKQYYTNFKPYVEKTIFEFKIVKESVKTKNLTKLELKPKWNFS